MILNSTEQQKEKFNSKVNEIFKKYDDLINEVNKGLTLYGRDFYRFSIGQYSLEYYTQQKEDVKSIIINLSQMAFIDMVNYLKDLKEEYIKECFPVVETTDPIELDFINKELELMSNEELKEFFTLNFLDKNKVRLFDIEVKKRKNKGEVVADLETLKDIAGVKDEVTTYIDELIKLLDGARQLLNSTFALFRLGVGGKLNPELKSFTEIFEFVEKQSKNNIPNKININELL